jgi:hypothetical protein
MLDCEAAMNIERHDKRVLLEDLLNKRRIELAQETAQRAEALKQAQEISASVANLDLAVQQASEMRRQQASAKLTARAEPIRDIARQAAQYLRSKGIAPTVTVPTVRVGKRPIITAYPLEVNMRAETWYKIHRTDKAGGESRESPYTVTVHEGLLLAEDGQILAFRASSLRKWKSGSFAVALTDEQLIRGPISEFGQGSIIFLPDMVKRVYEQAGAIPDMPGYGDQVYQRRLDRWHALVADAVLNHVRR